MTFIQMQKLVLDIFYNMVTLPNALVEIFLNYDADFESVDLFQKIVDAFARCAKEGLPHQKAAPSDSRCVLSHLDVK